MTDPNVTMRVVGDTNQAQTVIAQLEKKVDQLRGKLKGVTNETRRGAKDAGGFGKAIHGAATAMLGFNSIAAIGGKIVATLREDMERVAQLQKTAKETQVSSAVSFRKALVNFTPDNTVGSSRQLRKELLQISADTGADESDLSRAAADAASAKGKLSNRDFLNAIKVAAQVNPFDADTTRVLSSRLLDLQKITPGLTAEGGAGFLTQVGGASRITELSKLGKSFVPAAIALRKSGDTLEQSGELFSTLTQLTGDEEGDQAKTALISLAKQLESSDVFKGKKGATSTAARIRMLQQNQNLRDRFLKKAHFETGTEAGVVKLLRGDADAIAAQREAEAKVKNAMDPSQAAGFTKYAAELNSGYEQQQALADRKQKAAKRLRFLSDPASGLVESATEAEETVITASGIELPGIDAVSRAKRRYRMQVGKTNVEAGSLEPEVYAQRTIDELKDLRPLQNDENKALIDRMIKLMQEQLAEYKLMRQEMRARPNRHANGE